MNNDAELAYDMYCSDGNVVGKIITSFHNIRNSISFSFLPDRFVITSDIEHHEYSEILVEIPYECMPRIGYINPKCNLEGKTITVESRRSPVEAGSTPSVLNMRGYLDYYEIEMCFERSVSVRITNKLPVRSVRPCPISLPFINTDYSLVTCMEKIWLSEIMKLVTTKSKWEIVCSSNFVCFIIQGDTRFYPEKENRVQLRETTRRMPKYTTNFIKKLSTFNKGDIVKVISSQGRCWFSIPLGGWGCVSIKVGNHEDIGI